MSRGLDIALSIAAAVDLLARTDEHPDIAEAARQIRACHPSGDYSESDIAETLEEQLAEMRRVHCPAAPSAPAD